MENVAKALLIAAALLMTLILLATVVIFLDQLSGYFTERHEATMLEQLVEFNDKFQNYNGKTIRGNELVSIMNRVIDYNNYQSDMIGYEKILLDINLRGHQDDFTYGGKVGHPGETGDNLLIQSDHIRNSSENDEGLKNISEASSDLSRLLNGVGDTKLQKLSANIEHIVDEPKKATDESQEEFEARRDTYINFRKQKLTQILGNNYEEDYGDIDEIKKATFQYYQYTQFKRAMFVCKDIFYDVNTGRVNRMNFEVVLEDNKVKFD